MKVLVLGGSGELGSNFSKLCIEMGHDITIIDIIRFFEAWRLKELNIADQVKYVWKSSFDITTDDLHNLDLILDCACQADRPLGTDSPRYTLLENLFGPLSLLENLRMIARRGHKPLIIYPSSSVEFLGVPKEEQPITEETYPKPTNLYGLSKWMAEELYLTYHRTFKIPCTIIRTGSCYGPMMRTDQFIAQCIIKCLKNQDIEVKSPEATRTYTFTEDVLDFYRRFLGKFESEPQTVRGIILANGGNAENKPYTTWEVACLIRDLVGASRSTLTEADYEVGESIDGKPVFQWESSKLASFLLGWRPQHTLKEGLEKTIVWFREWLKSH